ncbi:MAG: Unknown protein [uncultured Campylobacterales bacterium]|uniref:Glycine transporter domain-containing protein n=1 Tax=uncultured Campylobacterales bacterium TaxID=352960 RepID=A0A6S6SVM1_9BACT|nr:MAG: Unknown protein [uncultured Campylobacterales bacterium]
MDFFLITDIIGLIAFSISGFLIAVEYKLDLLGTLISVFSTALLGGIIRDTIAGNTPFAFTHIYPSAVVITIFVITYVTNIYKKHDIEHHKSFVFVDAIGLASFSITGALVGINEGLNLFGVIFLSSITAIGGGMFRDMLLNAKPVFLDRGFYMSVAFVISIIVVTLNYFSYINDLSLICVFAFGLMLRMIAYTRKWGLPRL